MVTAAAPRPGEFVETDAEEAEAEQQGKGQGNGKGGRKSQGRAKGEVGAHTRRRDELQAVVDVADDLLAGWFDGVLPPLASELDFFLLPEHRLGNNPFGGRHVKKDPAKQYADGEGGEGEGPRAEPEHDKRLLKMFRHPNAHLLGFVRSE